MGYRRSAGLVFTFLCMLLTQQAEAQNDTTNVIKPIPLVEIPIFLEEANQVTREIDNLVKLPENLLEIQAYLNESDHEILEDYEALADSSRNFSLSEIENERGIWEDKENKINGYNTEITEYVSRLQRKIRDVGFIQLRWDTTAVVARDNTAPAEVMTMIKSARSGFEQRQTQLRSAQSEALKLQAALASYYSTVNEAKNLLEQRRTALLDNIWARDSPAIWNIRIDSANQVVTETVNRQASNLRRSIVNFTITHQAYLITLIVIFLSVLGYLMYLRLTRPIKLKEYENDKSIQLLIGNPVLVSLLFTIVSTFIIFNLPEAMMRIYALVIIIPSSWCLFIYSEKYRGVQVTIYAAIMSYYQFTILTAGNAYSRFYFLFLSFVMTIVLFGLIRSQRDYLVVSLVRRPIIRLILSVMLFLSFASILCNISGHFELSRLLIRGVYSSFNISIIFFLSADLLVGLSSLLLAISLLERSNIVKSKREYILSRLRAGIGLIAIIGWIYYALSAFKVNDAIIKGLVDLFITRFTLGAIELSLGNILAFFLTIQISIWLSRLVRFVLEEEVYVRRSGDKERAQGAILLMVRYSFICLGVILAFAAAGIQLSSITVIIGALGVGIGFGLQSIFNNLVSGIILAIERPMQVGDVVEVHDLLGTVKDIGFRASTIRTYDGSEVIVPNGDFVSSKLINWTLSDKKRRLTVDIRTSFSTDPDLVLYTLKQVALEDEMVLKNPAPIARFLGFGESYLKFQLMYWIPDYDTGFSMGTRVTSAVYNALQEAGIAMPIPRQEIHLNQSKDSETKKS